MTAHADCRATIRDPATGERADIVRVPAGMVLCLIPQETADALAVWTECCAARVVTFDDGTCTLEITNDLDWVTSPEAEK